MHSINETINQLMQSADFPLLTAFVLGLLVALNPCQLAISISALTYEYKKGKTVTNGIIYALGRTATYTILGCIVVILSKYGKEVNWIQNTLEKAEAAVPYVLIVIGIIFIVRAFHNHHHGDNCHNSGNIIKRNGPLGSFILGMLLALAFCPESAIFYFGMMIPLGVSTDMSILVPLTFAFGAFFPVAIIAWGIGKTINTANTLSKRFNKLQKWLNIISGILFITFAVLLIAE